MKSGARGVAAAVAFAVGASLLVACSEEGGQPAAPEEGVVASTDFFGYLLDTTLPTSNAASRVGAGREFPDARRVLGRHAETDRSGGTSARVRNSREA